MFCPICHSGSCWHLISNQQLGASQQMNQNEFMDYYRKFQISSPPIAATSDHKKEKVKKINKLLLLLR